MQKILIILFLFCTTSCARNHNSDVKKNFISDIISGTRKVNKSKNTDVINIVRAIGSPDSIQNVSGFTYYKWMHSRFFGVSTLFGGGSTTFYCNLTVETKNQKIQKLHWSGN